jgi:two-component system response regulator WspF
MRIAIVNDMRMALEVLKRILATAPQHEIAWIAMDGEEAVASCQADTPDLILMDLIMPNMDGVEATRQIMTSAQCAILVVTASVGGNASKVYEAMSFGALDATNTPTIGADGKQNGAEGLLSKIEEIGALIAKPSVPAVINTDPLFIQDFETPLPPILGIGASTGGPQAIASILSKLPADYPAAVIVIQHIDQDFPQGLADWLDTQTELTVRIVKEGEIPRPGFVWLAGKNDHLVLNAGGHLHYTPHPTNNAYRPSVDAFFKSATAIAPGKLIAVLLTGMGPDGASGMLNLRQAGHYTIAQDQDTSVVYGMPKAAAEMNAAEQILPLDEIPSAIIAHSFTD